MRKLRITRSVLAAIALVAAPLTARASVELLPVTPYTSFSGTPGIVSPAYAPNSPFSVNTPSTFYLETFEDRHLNTLGVTATAVGATWGVGHDPSFVDSVDGDDNSTIIDGGTIDGDGSTGWSMGISGTGPPHYSTIIFAFNPGVLGQYPTHVGIVFTDMGRSLDSDDEQDTFMNGYGKFQFQAFGPMGNLLGTIGPVDVGDKVKNGTTGEDRFFGAIDLDGISRFEVTLNGHDAELDHLQYGFNADETAATPEPASVLVWGGLGVAVALRLRNRL